MPDMGLIQLKKKKINYVASLGIWYLEGKKILN